MNATLSCKYNIQRILVPGDLNWVQHGVSRLGLLPPETWRYNFLSHYPHVSSVKALGINYTQIRNIFPNMVFPPVLGEKWRHSEHAPASNTGVSLFPPGFQAHFQGGVRVSPGTGLNKAETAIHGCQ